MATITRYFRWVFAGGNLRRGANFTLWAVMGLFILGAVLGSGDKTTSPSESPSVSANNDAKPPQAVAAEASATPLPSTSTTAPEPTATKVPPTQTATRVSSQGLQRGTVGQVVHVGDLDLTITAVKSFNSTAYNMFNDANIAVTFTATNARGKANAAYQFSPLLALTLVDPNGVAHDPTICSGCPNDITESVGLTLGGSVSGNVYFKMPAGGWKEVRYQAFLSTNQAIITP